MACPLLTSPNKRALRKSVTATLRSLPPTDVQEQSHAIAARVLSLPSFAKSKTVSCYLSMPTGEVDTSPLVSEILRAGKSLFVPKIDRSTEGRMEFLKVYGEEDLQPFPSGLWGIREPEHTWGEHRRMSGVAFDRSLSRLGHGKGYYDRFITRYTLLAGRQRPLLGKVALALREQVLEDGQVPTADHDWKMDLIVSPDGVIGQDGSR
ncbi:nagb/rpia/CoA transferase-like protein [Gloeophyllum trabeum ATCC 11539]|uniref:5-formyltetrahydrofolate cyclo-ligase n=1 Tax=Gloeophyllum trabeum (strain ATCC 11539 / FP-39264 / Madison 617) TaxID=670483 RepID=S7RHL4_GLOTA|nr:nagb/rpia/CoA transferase-like protein [Gloeophyllum trabeum ATCC 11539]EPQ52084.1 nagb/rpia/CoA transferase-like protein [Gloeophyllum trabeum ATCC 11539]